MLSLCTVVIFTMHFSQELWKLFAGIAIFLLGMRFMEEAMQQLAGRRFKLFLRRQTKHPLRAILGGAGATAIMQSSSVVNLLVLSLVGAGILNMQGALAMMLGANVGTTLTGWLIAAVGFSFSIDQFALPLLAIAGMVVGFTKAESKLKRWFTFAMGLAFLFLGLSYMRSGMESFVQSADLTLLKDKPLIFFLLAGLALTMLVQSSSVTMALALSALHAQAIDLVMAAGLVLGAEIGTTVKLAIASVHGIPAKKRVALGNILFNTITATGMFFLLGTVLKGIEQIAGISNPLYALVFFHSFFNIAGILFFYPMLRVFARFLERQFKAENETHYLQHVSLADTDLALEALEKETKHFFETVFAFAQHALQALENSSSNKVQPHFTHKLPVLQYDEVKKLYGEIHQYFVRLQQQPVDVKATERLQQLVVALRNGMYAAKNMKDALPDIQQLSNSSNDLKYDFYCKLRENTGAFLVTSSQLLQELPVHQRFDALRQLLESVQVHYNEAMQFLYRRGIEQALTETEISTLFNFNREIITACKSVVYALKDYLLTTEEANYFDELPGFIR